MIPIRERLQQRLQRDGPAFIPTEIARRQIELFFLEHPASEDAYLFFDGRVVDGPTFRRSMTSRTVQLVGIATDGIPVNVSRVHTKVARFNGASV